MVVRSEKTSRLLEKLYVVRFPIITSEKFEPQRISGH